MSTYCYVSAGPSAGTAGADVALACIHILCSIISKPYFVNAIIMILSRCEFHIHDASLVGIFLIFQVS